MSQNQIPEIIVDAINYKLEKAITKYAESPYTTNAGAVLRFVAKILPVSWLIKMLAHKISPR